MVTIMSPTAPTKSSPPFNAMLALLAIVLACAKRITNGSPTIGYVKFVIVVASPVTKDLMVMPSLDKAGVAEEARVFSFTSGIEGTTTLMLSQYTVPGAPTPKSNRIELHPAAGVNVA